MFSPRLLEFFQRALFSGRVDHPDAAVEVENPVCGDRLALSIRLKEGRAEELRYLARGCVAAMGCAAAFTEMVQHWPLARVAAVSADDLLARVDSLPAESHHALALVLEARDRLLERLPRS